MLVRNVVMTSSKISKQQGSNKIWESQTQLWRCQTKYLATVCIFGILWWQQNHFFKKKIFKNCSVKNWRDKISSAQWIYTKKSKVSWITCILVMLRSRWTLTSDCWKQSMSYMRCVWLTMQLRIWFSKNLNWSSLLLQRNKVCSGLTPYTTVYTRNFWSSRCKTTKFPYSSISSQLEKVKNAIFAIVSGSS